MINTTMISTDSITVGERVRQDLGDLTDLAQSITANGGLIQPIVVTRSHELVCGERRLAALRELDWTQAPIVYLDSESGAAQVLAERDENTCRKPFSPVEASRARDRVRDAFAVDGKQRQDAGREKAHASRRGEDVGSGNLPEPAERSAQETRNIAAAGTGYSGKTLDKVDQIRSAAERGVVKQGKTEREVPAEVREVAQQGLADVSQTGAAVDKSYQRLSSAVDQYVAADPDVQRAKFVKAWFDTVKQASRVEEFDIDRLADTLDADDWETTETLLRGLIRWAERVLQHRPEPGKLRSIGGK